MKDKCCTVITGTGSYIPEKIVPNEAFLDHTFFDEDGNPYDRSNEQIIQKFEQITGIKERRYAREDVLASDMGAAAGRKALEDADIDPETLDYIVVAHNFGDVRTHNRKVDMVPSLGSRVKQKLNVTNPQCIAYDLPFGCPGWLQAMIQVNCFIKSGEASKALIVGSETLSRVCDPHDRDSMIYSDGAGAAIIESVENEHPAGIIASAAHTDTLRQAYYLNMDTSSSPHCSDEDTLYLKKEGRKLYEYALRHVPKVVKLSLDKADLAIEDIKKVFIHQANAKMDKAILKRLLKLYDKTDCADGFMPMTISWLGNSSVATVPTLFDLVRRGELENHRIAGGDTIVFASVGAGMNINSVVYTLPA